MIGKGLETTDEDVIEDVGEIPAFCSQISPIRVSNLRNNSIEGPIPNNLSSLESLQRLDLSNNNLTRQIPASLGELTGVAHDPSDEDIFSFDLLYFLTYKSLLHPDKIIRKARQIIWEKVSSHPAPGQIYTSLDLSKNQLSGDVPDSIGGLKSLKLLSISYSKLSGRTPISFGDLESLESLDLSHNTLRRNTTNVRKAFATYSLGIE
ncbi:hypothetical protein NC652_040843 [Populus alba x Populus x berolinensis]|nr:hypothetical protein NC652_040843 [Populus alba x Populus x berolinensis]